MPSRTVAAAARCADPASRRDADELGRIIGRAFLADPVSRWCMQDEVAILGVYDTLVRELYLPRGHCVIAEGAAATLWLWPGGRKRLGWSAQVRTASLLLRSAGGLAVRRSLRVDRALRQHRPSVPHFYLFAVGALPEARGQGLATGLIRRTLDAADLVEMPAYLENTNPANESIYRGLGFLPCETFSPAPGCPPVTAMWRAPPRPASGGPARTGRYAG